MLIKVEGTVFSKDTQTGALLTTTKSVIAENEARKKISKAMTDKNNEINSLKTKVDDLSSDVQEIKSLLTKLLQSKQ
jgi:seryl-tRNA synthetase